MNAFFQLDRIAWWDVAGWTMLHYLWLGAVVGLAATLCRLIMLRASADARYVVAVASLAVLALLPLGISGWLIAKSPAIDYAAETNRVAKNVAPVADGIIELHERAPIPSLATSPTAPGSAGSFAVVGAESPNAAAEIADPANPRQSRGLIGSFGALEACVPYLPWLWVMGTPFTFALLATGVVGAERLRRASREIHDGPLAEACARLQRSLHVSRQVTIAVCERIAAPVLVGILRPIILLPPAALTGWSPDEIEMVLLHELAHVRRWDNLVNLVQRLIESLLFFHPAVWLVSGWVRREREACCDSLVVRRTERPHAYAELLVALAAQMPRSVLFHPAASSAMAAGTLRARIRCILKLEDDPMLVSGKSFALALSGLLVSGVLAVLYLPAVTQGEESAAEATEDSETPSGDAEVRGNVVEPSTDELRIDEPRIDTPTGEVVIESDAGQVKLRSAVASQDSDVGRTIVAIPNDGAQQHWTKLFDAVDAAREKGQYVDLVPKGASWELVVAREPRESDWPAMLGDPPRKERVIAEKAWQTLGLKLVPASLLETWDKDVRGRAGSRIKIIGGAVPNGLPLPAFLQKIDTTTLDSFDDLNTWLNNVNSSGPFKVYAAAGGHDYLFDTQLPQEPQENMPVDSTSPATQSTVAIRFPSLEDQKLADLAYKRLGLEMEPISAEELQRLQALGYDGGLKVTAGAAGTGGDVIQTGDILLGLHVWPTTSMKDLVEVLNREDLADLNPLKFYVVRQPNARTHKTPKDVVITGRVSVNLGGPFGGGGGQFMRRTSVAVPATDRAAQRPTDASKANLRYDGKTFDQWRDSWRNELSTDRRMEAVKALAAYGAAGYGEEAAKAILDVAREYDWMVMGGDSPVSNLKKQTITAFAGGADVTSIPMEDWLPVLTDAVRSGDKNTDMFAYWVFSEVNTRSDDDVMRLIELSRGDQLKGKDVRLGILQRLSQIHQSRSDARIAERMIEALKDPDTAWVALTALYGQEGARMLRGGMLREGGGYFSRMMGRGQIESKLEYRPELLDALGYDDANLRSQVIQVLLQLGPKAKPAVPKLLPLLFEFDDPSAAELLLAIEAITGSDQAATAYLVGMVEKAPSPEKAKRAQSLLRKLQHMRETTRGGRGSSRGGGMQPGFRGEGGGYGRGMTGEGESMGMERATEEGEASEADVFGPGEEGRGTVETGDDALFGPATPEGESGEKESTE